MKTITFMVSILINCFLSFSQRYEGALIDSKVVPEYAKGSETIMSSIAMDVRNLNLLEYAYALPELYEVMHQGKVTERQWKDYMDLQNEILLSTKDTLKPLYVGQFKGLIPLQFQFFEATLERNKELKEKYHAEYKILKQYQIDLQYEYKQAEIPNLITFSEVVGETNFWYFLQLEGCTLVEALKNNENLMKRIVISATYFEITSTYKTPYYLQLRKLKDLQNRLSESKYPSCMEISLLLNKRTIAIEDKNMSFFEEHPGWDMIREF